MSKKDREYNELLVRLMEATDDHINTIRDYMETCDELIKVMNENCELKAEIWRLQIEKSNTRQD